MDLLARLLLRKDIAWSVTALVLVVAGLFAMLARSVQQDDDLLAFLPDGNAEVALFEDINHRFGGLDVALIGIEAGDTLFGADFLGRLQRTTDGLGDLKSVSYALSITNLEDLSPDPEFGGIKLATLVDALPASAADEEALRRKVMSRDSAVGNLVSAAGDAVLIYAFALPGSDPRSTAEQIRAVVDQEFDEHRRYWGGAPFVSSYIYDTTDRDMARLTPWAVLAIILVLMGTFRDLIGTALALLTTGIGIVIAHGSMALAGQSFNIVLSSMPIILFAVGSAYSIHILSHYYAHRDALGRDEALRTTLVTLGPVVLAAGLTTVAGLLSFVMMDIEPMRTFGLFTALGILSTLVLSITFVPAIIRITDLKRRSPPTGSFTAAMARLSCAVVENRRAVSGAVIVLVLLAAVFAGRVDARMDQSSFFSEGSPPDLSETFLGEHFGGSQFIQVHVRGNMKSPQVLRELQRIGDLIRIEPGVTDVMHVGLAVSLANEAMEGTRRIPDSAEKIGLLYGLIQGNKAVSQLVSDARDEALLQVKVALTGAEDVEELLGKIEVLVADTALRSYRVADRAQDAEPVAARLHELVLLRIRALLTEFAVGLNMGDTDRIAALLKGNRPEPAQDRILASLERFIRSEECVADLPKDDPELATRLAAGLAALGPGPQDDAVVAAIRVAVLATPTAAPPATDAASESQLALIDDLDFSVATALRETWSQESAKAAADGLITASGLVVPEGDPGQRLRARLAATLLDLDLDSAMLPVANTAAESSVEWQVSGLPVLHRGLSRSVTANQTRSLAVALLLVLILMTLFFRSFKAGMLATSPTAFTLLLVFGAMGALGVHLDIGTSMLSSIIIGAGVDYGVHLLAGWRASDEQGLKVAAHNAAHDTSEAIWTNAAMVAIGFFVLTLGEARPLQNVGALTASAMITAGAATFVVIPMLARRCRYTAH